MQTTVVTLVMHLEAAEDQWHWWIETADVEGFSALGTSLEQARSRALAALDDILGADCYTVREELSRRDEERTPGHQTTISGAREQLVTA